MPQGIDRFGGLPPRGLSTVQNTVVARKGETLSEVALRLKVEVDQLLTANPQIKDPDKVITGQDITLPRKMEVRLTRVAVPTAGKDSYEKCQKSIFPQREQETKPEIRSEIRPEVLYEIRPQAAPEIGPQITAELKHAIRPEIGPPSVSEVKVELHPEIRQEAGPEEKPQTKLENK